MHDHVGENRVPTAGEERGEQAAQRGTERLDCPYSVARRSALAHGAEQQGRKKLKEGGCNKVGSVVSRGVTYYCLSAGELAFA